MPLPCTSILLLPVIPLLGQAGRQKYRMDIIPPWNYAIQFSLQKENESNNNLDVLAEGKLCLLCLCVSLQYLLMYLHIFMQILCISPALF